MPSLSPLQRARISYQPNVPALLKNSASILAFPDETLPLKDPDLIKNLFPNTSKAPFLSFKQAPLTQTPLPLKVGVVLSGGQASGGHNVIVGLFDAIKEIHPDSVLIGFLDGPGGIVKNQSIEITEQLLSSYRNQGGFDIIGSGRTKIETDEQFAAAEKTVLALALNGLVIIGGDDSNTNAAFLAEHFKKKKIPVDVVGVPKTIDGDLRNEHIEISFGFDTACKTYSEIIGNIAKDSLSSKKYYFFIRLMGRSASHITLECAHKTHPNLSLIGEEIAEKKWGLKEVVQQIVTMITKRAAKGKNYGIILIPEGIIEFIPDVEQMLKELSVILAKGTFNPEKLSIESLKTFEMFPESIQQQLLLDRDPHGNVQVSKIESERFLLDLVEKELKKLEKEGTYKGKFNPQPLFFGYEGRSALPSNFDSDYCYTLGKLAAVLLNNHASGYMACVKKLSKPAHEWKIMGLPIHTLLHEEERGGKKKVVIKKALVDLSSRSFINFCENRERWMFEDEYLCPGPIQFLGDISTSSPIGNSYE